MNPTKIIRIFCLAIVCAMLLGIFVGCKAEDEESSGTESITDNGTTEDVLAPLSLLQDGKPVKIIVSKNATAADTKIATDIMKIFGDITNVTMFPKQDTEAVGEDEVAILVGNTVIPESDLVYRELEQTYGYSYGTVRVKNNKIVIAGLSDSVKERCANELKKEINKLSIKSENIELSRDYCVDILDSKMLNNIPVSQDIKAQSAIDTGDSCYMVNFGEVDSAAATNYVALLKENGYKTYAENRIDGNVYTTLTKSNLTATVLYTGYNKLLKVLVEPTSELASATFENTYTVDDPVDTLFTQIGIMTPEGTYDYLRNGNSYVTRLADGSFIIIDGGVDFRDSDADRIYETLKKQTPQGKDIVIAAWIFTHSHMDHTGAFLVFSKKYSDEVTVEKFIMNLCTVQQYKQLDSESQNIKVREAIRQHFSGVPIIKAHPGQVFNIRNAKITVLYTLDVYEAPLTDFNNTSIVFTLEAEGVKIMNFADYSDNGYTVKNLYSKQTLKSDAVQLMHHGWSGMNNDDILYLVEPEHVFWPTPKLKYPEWGIDLTTNAMNQYVMNVVDQSKVYVMSDDIFVATLKDGNMSVQKYESIDAYKAS